MSRVFLATAILIILGSLYARFVEPHIILVRKVRIDGRRAASGGKPLRISLLSDFHYPRYASFRMVRRAIGKSNGFDPDLVFLLGDFFDKNRTDPAVLPDHIHALFGGIQSKAGIFGVLGNHDHWFDAPAIRKALQAQTDIQLLDNEAALVAASGTPVYVVGVGDLWGGTVDYDRATAAVPENAAILLLSHNPDIVESISDPRIIIQFSGHTHGGQVRLPFIGAIRVPSKFGNRYAKGLIKCGNHPLYVNSGICSMKGIRFLCPPEVTWVEIY